MKLSKPMIRTFTLVTRGVNTIETIAKAQHKSVNWITEVLQDLEKEAFIVKKGNYSIKRSRILIEIASTYHALKLKELLFSYPGISFENVLAESRLLFLAAISEDWMNLKRAAELSGISKYIIERYRPQLKSRGIIVKKNKLYKLNEKAWPLLKEFIVAYKNYSTIEGNIKWKYNEEILFEINDAKLIQGALTGLYSYKDYGVKVGVISALCYLPKKELSKEEIFVHSLFEVNDPRTLNLALTFYIKNKLIHKKVLPIAMKYGKYTMFDSMIALLKMKEENLKVDGLPAFERKDFIRIAKMYGVKDV